MQILSYTIIFKNINISYFLDLLNSGGQKRRVSLAVAVIHKPGLLVLDEPSVGLDPLLRQRYKIRGFAMLRS